MLGNYTFFSFRFIMSIKQNNNTDTTQKKKKKKKSGKVVLLEKGEKETIWKATLENTINILDFIAFNAERDLFEIK